MRVTSLLFFTLSACTSAHTAHAPVSPAVISVEVVDELGDRVSANPILEGRMRFRARRSNGITTFYEMDPGGYLITANVIGHYQPATYVRVNAGDSIYVQLQTARTDIVPGGDLPTPLNLALDSERLRRVLEDSTVRRLSIKAIEVAATDTVRVIAPWSSPMVVSKRPGPNFKVVRDCPECVKSRTTTMEGGVRYVAAIDHLYLGVINPSRKPDALLLCFQFLRAGESNYGNCDSGIRTYAIFVNSLPK